MPDSLDKMQKAGGPFVGCDTCRIPVDSKHVQKWYDPKRGKWIYRISCHGQQFEEERIPAPFADSQPIRVGTWSPTFKCPTCQRTGIRPEQLKRGYPVPHQTTFQIHHCGTLYCEAFITDSLEKESGERARGRATPTLDGVELSNYQGITPFAPDPVPVTGHPDWTEHQKSINQIDPGKEPAKANYAFRLGNFDLCKQFLTNQGDVMMTVQMHGRPYEWHPMQGRYIEAKPLPAPASSAPQIGGPLFPVGGTYIGQPKPAKKEPETTGLPAAAIPIHVIPTRRVRFKKGAEE